ncbi:glycoside hydrolase family 16 protein [Rhizobium sp. G21]|uniref:glycoside hydrolase family 16 protein n=1 Tax=Rhizobium sp. G21 TaxID=2758439 RepID=UPI0015FEE75D|nr:glycoside hydrolase family 16 protein [Rhizobium sp. G21]MBB1249191.1 glycoside hydrolase family 16 protein [Rhizobium sp. G21]
MKRLVLAACLLAALAATPVEAAKRIRFSGYDFTVKIGEGLGPGPNRWAASQARVDGQGRLHLRLSRDDEGRWTSGEIQSVSRFGYGTYEMEWEGDIGGQDKNVVFGFFNYPSAEVGPDTTNEIDVEFARWGDRANKPLNFTVWPAKDDLKQTGKSFSWPRGVSRSRHVFVWSRKSVDYTSVLLDSDGDALKTVSWRYAPTDHQDRIGSKPMSIFFNLWGFRGKPPSDGKPVEAIVTKFKFTPAK